jgi:hypothetical protein
MKTFALQMRGDIEHAERRVGLHNLLLVSVLGDKIAVRE